MRSLIAALAATALAALAPAFAPRPSVDGGAFPGWPTTLGGRTLRALALTAREADFAREFPGRVGRFEDGERQYVLRYVERPTRLLHPAADCLRGSGYVVAPLPAAHAGAGLPASCVLATREGEALRVCERIEDARGASWGDPSSWYWAALLGRSSGPWWAVTTIEVAPEP